MNELTAFLPYLQIGVPVLLFIILLLACWRKVPVDQAMVITGLKKRVLTGKGGFMVPLIEAACVVSLENMSMTTDVTEAPSQQGIFVDIVGTAVVKIRNESTAIFKAVEQFHTGNYSTERTKEKISGMVEQILEGKLRGIISTMTVEQINNDRSAFERKIEEDINKELDEMGLHLISYSILKISTQGGYLENRARPQVAQSKADAEVAEAERKRDTDIKTAEAIREGEKVKLAADAEVAQSERDKQIKIEQFRAEQDKAKADADVAYKLQEIRNQSTVAERAAELAKKQALVVEEELVATVKKPADARKYESEVTAEAQKIKTIKEAQAEAEKMLLLAKAKADALKMEAEAEANAIRLRGEAEAASIQAKGIAEAAAKEKVAEAMAKYGQAAITEMVVNQMPKIMAEVARPMEQIDKITVIDNGGDQGASKVAKTVTDVTTNGFELVKSLTGIDLTAAIQGFVNQDQDEVRG